MGQVLFWLVASVASVLFIALGMAIVVRVRRPGQRRGVRVAWMVFHVAWWIFAIGPWLAVIGMFVLYTVFSGGGYLVPLVMSSLAGVAFVVSAVVVCRRGRRPSVTVGGPVSATWRLHRLALAWAAAVLLGCMTWWNLDLVVRQEMAALKVEAGAIAQSVAPLRIPASLNAAPLYRQVWDMLDAQDTTETTWTGLVAEWLSPSEGEFDSNNEQMLAFLDKQAPAIELLRKASQMPGCDFGVNYNQLSVETLMPGLGQARSSVRLFCLSARVAAHRGDTVQAMRDLNTALAMADHCTTDPTLIATLVAVAIQDLTFKTFQYVLDQGGLTADSAAAFSMNSSRDFNRSLHRSTRIETAFSMSIFIMQDRTTALSTHISDEDPRLSVADSPLYRVFLWQNDVKAYLLWMRWNERLSSQPYHASVQGWKQRAGLSQDEWVKGIGSLFGSMIAPTFSRAAEMSAEADAKHRLMTLAVAMWNYRLEEGEFPDEFSQLVPRYVLTVPVDPFTGKSLKLVRLADGGVTMYSVGPDLTDDGGVSMDPKARSSGGVPVPGDIVLMLGVHGRERP